GVHLEDEVDASAQIQPQLDPLLQGLGEGRRAGPDPLLPGVGIAGQDVAGRQPGDHHQNHENTPTEPLGQKTSLCGTVDSTGKAVACQLWDGLDTVTQ